MTRSYRPTSVITGGSGFLGSHLCDRLIAEGHRVICVDNLLTGNPENVAHLLESPDFSMVRHDVTEPLRLEAFLASSGHTSNGSRIDYVLHFASPASPKDYARHPIHTLKVGALGTYHSLGLARAHRSTFLLASSSEVYGDPEISPQPESYVGHVNPVGPRSVYDEAKRFAEALAAAYYGAHGMDVRIARIFNTYGPRMRVGDGRAVPAFMAQALRGEPLTVYGDGSQTRSFCYVDDLIEGLYRLLTYDSSRIPAINTGRTGLDEGGGGKSPELPLIINIGNPEEVTVLQVAREIISITGSPSAIVLCPLPEDDPRTRRPDITRARQVLGWEPGVARLEGLRKLVPYFRDALKKQPA